MPIPDEPSAIYAHVAAALAAAVEEPWREIVLRIDTVEGSIGLTGDYATPDGARCDLDVRRLDYSVSKALRNLNRQMAGTAAAWSDAAFHLSQDGGFRFAVLR